MEHETKVINGKTQKLIGRMKAVGYNSHMIRLAKELVNELQQRGIYGIDRFVKKLSYFLY